MQLLGTILHRTKQDRLVVRCKSKGLTPKVGRSVLRKNSDIIGKVADIFGPEELPYVSVRAMKKPRPEIGEEVYLN